MALLKDVMPLDGYNDTDLAIIENLPVLIIDRVIYTGKISSKIEKILMKHLDYREGVIYE